MKREMPSSGKTYIRVVVYPVLTGQKMALFSVDVLNSKHETHWMFKAELVPTILSNGRNEVSIM
jgi:hypothetical protein